MPPLGPIDAGGVPTGDIDLTATDPLTDDPDVTGSTDLTLKLKITLVATVDTIAMPSADAAVDVNPTTGAADVPIECPAGAACAGTVALGLGGVAAGGAGDVERTAAVHYPGPVTTKEPTLASASFHLHGGQRGVTVHLIPSAMYLKAISHTTLDVIVTERSGSHRLSYDAGLAHLKIR